MYTKLDIIPSIKQEEITDKFFAEFDKYLTTIKTNSK